jgi:hypothetical protein
MSDLVFGEEVELRPHSIDRYGRTVAQVIIDGNDVGIEMLRQGLVWVYDRYIAEASTDIQKSYRSAQEQTKAERLGMWSDPNCIPPWIFRHSAKAHQEQAIASNWMEAHQRHIDPNSSLTSPTPLELPLSPDEVWANIQKRKVLESRLALLRQNQKRRIHVRKRGSPEGVSASERYGRMNYGL